MVKSINKVFGIIAMIFISSCIPTNNDKKIDEGKDITLTYKNNLLVVDGKYILDSNAILNNKNLQYLIQELEKSEHRDINKVAEIPSFVKTFLDSLTGFFSIANAGEEWQHGCTVPTEFDYSNGEKTIESKTGDTVNTFTTKPKNIPSRQLIYFGLGKETALMTYYTGGIGVSVHILIFQFKADKMIDFWCGNVLTDLTNKEEIMGYLKENNGSDEKQNTGNINL